MTVPLGVVAPQHAELMPDTHDRVTVVAGADRTEYFPAVWDVQHAFGAVRATGATYVTLPVPLNPYVGLRVRGQRVFGEFPFHQAAFIGGRGGVRTLDPQRYAGDASLAGKLELRIPLFDFDLLLPLNTGVFAVQEVGRVYLDGASPEGWHRTFGVGFWVGVHDIVLGVRLSETTQDGRSTEPSVWFGPSVGIP